MAGIETESLAYSITSDAQSTKIDRKLSSRKSTETYDEGLEKQRGINCYSILVLISSVLGGLIFGLDIGAGPVNTMVPFREKMNITLLGPNGDDSETADKVAMFSVVFHITTLLAALPSGWLSDRFGRKPIILAAMLLVAAGDTWQITAGEINPDFAWTSFLLGRAVGGIGNGFILTVFPVYAAELSPANIRGKILTTFQLMITIGILIVAIICNFVSEDEWGWKLAIGVQIVPAVFISILTLFVLPESPRFLVRVGKADEAKNALNKLAKGTPEIEKVVQFELEEIEEEVQELKEAGEGTPLELLKRTALPAFLCGFFLAFCQNITGVNWFMNYATNIFQSLGFTDQMKFTLDAALKSVNVVFTIIAFFMVEVFGRKYLAFWGIMVVIVIFFLIAIVATGTGVDIGTHSDEPIASAVQTFTVVMIYLFQATFAVTWGPVAWIVPSEIFPVRLRGVGMGAAVTANMITQIALGDYGYLKLASIPSIGLTNAVWIVFALNIIIVLPVVIFLQPETYGVSLEDMRYIFAYEKGGNSAENHGTLREFFKRNMKQTGTLLTCKTINVKKDIEPFLQHENGAIDPHMGSHGSSKKTSVINM